MRDDDPAIFYLGILIHPIAGQHHYLCVCSDIIRFEDIHEHFTTPTERVVTCNICYLEKNIHCYYRCSTCRNTHCHRCHYHICKTINTCPFCREPMLILADLRRANSTDVVNSSRKLMLLAAITASIILFTIIVAIMY